jgi:Lrp/AsnC family transcriptional regulator, regulator for asnA, asnC and gidA
MQRTGTKEQRQNQDLALITVLQRDGRKSLKQLAAEVGVSTITLQRSIKRLIADDVLHIGAVINPEKAGFPIACMVSLEVSNAKLQRVASRLIRHEAVNTISRMTGRFNVMAFVRFRGLDELFSFSQKILDRIDGILDHEIDLCISVKKGRYTMLNPNLIDLPNRDLIDSLITDGRSSNHKLAKMLGVSPSTVQRAIKKMVDDGIMRVTAITDPVKTGLPVAVAFGLNVVPNRRHRIVEILTPHAEIEFLAKTTGRFDLLALARFPSNKSFSRFLEKSITPVKGVNNVETMLILEINYGTMYGGKLKPTVAFP